MIGQQTHDRRLVTWSRDMKEYEDNKAYVDNAVLVWTTIVILFSIIMAFSETASYLPFN